MVGKILKTSYGRTYEVLAGPFDGDNAGNDLLYVTRELGDNIVELKSANLIASWEEVDQS